MKGVDYENTMSADQNVVANAKSPDGGIVLYDHILADGYKRFLASIPETSE